MKFLHAWVLIPLMLASCGREDAEVNLSLLWTHITITEELSFNEELDISFAAERSDGLVVEFTTAKEDACDWIVESQEEGVLTLSGTPGIEDTNLNCFLLITAEKGTELEETRELIIYVRPVELTWDQGDDLTVHKKAGEYIHYSYGAKLPNDEVASLSAETSGSCDWLSINQQKTGALEISGLTTEDINGTSCEITIWADKGSEWEESKTLTISQYYLANSREELGTLLYQETPPEYIKLNFSDASNLYRDIIKPIDPEFEVVSLVHWDVSSVNNMSHMFSDQGYKDGGWYIYSTPFNQDISGWDVSNVTDMSHMFQSATMFNQPIGEWNVSLVVNMKGMFQNTWHFNQDIGEWNVSNVEDMSNMFYGARDFNQNIGRWKLTKLNNMAGMFYAASDFNQPVGDWDLSKVTNMEKLFQYARSFNQDISAWNVSQVINMENMFTEAVTFNQDIGGWDVYNVENMNYMFEGATNFNQALNDWKVDNVKSMIFMFAKASSFNQPLGSWVLKNVTNISGMFYEAITFNQDINGWNVSQVIHMEATFWRASAFNQDIGRWDVSKVTNMTHMFTHAISFNQDLNSWVTSSLTEKEGIFFNTPMASNPPSWYIED